MDENENNPIPSPTTASTVSAVELADSLCAVLSLDQLGLLRIFARCSINGSSHVQFSEIADSFAQELPRRRRQVIAAIANSVGQGVPFLESLANGTHANYRLIEEALKAASQFDCFKPFLAAVLDCEPVKRPLALVHQDSLRKKLMRLAIKTLIILQLVIFIMMFIVPEFQRMTDDFGAERTFIFSRFVLITKFVVHFWFIPALLFLCAAIYFFLTTSELFARLTRKFSPWRWLDRTLLPQQRRKLVFAWLGGSYADTDASATPKMKANEKEALDTATSPATRSWIIRHAVKENVERRWRWLNRFGDAFVLGWNIILAVIVAAAAASIISTLISIIESINE